MSGQDLTLQTRALGRTGLKISAIGLGTAAIGNDPADDEAGIATIRRAVERGINWIDTAPIYGGRRTEGVVGRALNGLPERPFVIAKTSMTFLNGRIQHRLDRASIRLKFTETLERLQMETIDLFFVHWPIPETDIEEGWSTLAELKEEGRIRFLGASNFDVPQLERAARIAPVDVVQAPYSIIRREAEAKLIPYCVSEDIGFLAWGAMGSGLFAGAITREKLANMSGDPRKRSAAFTEPRLTASLNLYEHVREAAGLRGVSTGALAIAWTLANPGVSGAIVGVREPEWVDEILAGGQLELTPEEAEHLSHAN